MLEEPEFRSLRFVEPQLLVSCPDVDTGPIALQLPEVCLNSPEVSCLFIKHHSIIRASMETDLVVRELKSSRRVGFVLRVPGGCLAGFILSLLPGSQVGLCTAFEVDGFLWRPSGGRFSC